ncbi:MAG TPA: acyloxyacyl hydrolase [Pyrinomonadaceae bacterium]|nr:acyloxyacyl hydrolase [Pyrinomonadaceae bacterium]
MSTGLRVFAATVLAILVHTIAASAQTSEQITGPLATRIKYQERIDSLTEPSPTYRLSKGDNEFGFWGGVSFKATTIFGGLTDAEASDRKFVLAAFRYGRTLAANDSLALQYTLDAIPLALATGNIVSSTSSFGVTTFVRETAYGAGLTPLGLQLDFSNGSRVHPFVHVNGGGLIFNKSVPLPDAGRFAFVGETGGGLRIFTSERRAWSLGLRFHHISNGDRTGSNRGLNQFVFYAGYSVFR